MRWRASWARAHAEFVADFPHGSGAEPGVALGPGDCERVVAELLRYAEPGAALPEDRVPCTYRWITDGGAGDGESGDGGAGDGASSADERVVGFVAVRHRLNDWLREQGGHIGYSVAPPHRGRGHAGRALGLALGEAARLGLSRVLVTCEEDNVASRRTIEGAGGVLEDRRHGKRRYWCEVSSGR